MIYTLALTHDNKLLENLSVQELIEPNIKWYWVDFSSPTNEETKLLESHFQFHHLAIEDCLNFLQRPKIDYYGDYSFYVFHALMPKTREVEEVDCFFGKNFLVSFHKNRIPSFNRIKGIIKNSKDIAEWQVIDVLHELLDSIVDMYFPIMYQLEDTITKLDENTQGLSNKKILEEVFDTRGDLIQLRKTFVPMRELLYRMINSSKLINSSQTKPYFVDIHDHLLRLSDMLDANRDLTSDIRDNYISINAHRMNSIMMTLTIITTIFMPLTFIAGVYGMNFDYMPELSFKYGYYIVLGTMAFVAGGLFFWFKSKGWLKQL